MYKIVMKLYFVLFSVLVTYCSSCPKAKPCGEFNLECIPVVSEHRVELPGVKAHLTFNFNPDLCGSSHCQCDKIVFIQLVRMLDIPNQKFYTLDPAEQDARMVASGIAKGWWIDRPAGADYGFFKYDNNGNIIPGGVIPGSNSKTAELNDTPIYQLKKWQLWEFIDVPICISGGCVNKALGYYHWSFQIDKDGKVKQEYISKGGSKDYFEYLIATVNAWNNVAISQGKKLLPVFIQLRDP
jgi:hypothetical protein